MIGYLNAYSTSPNDVERIGILFFLEENISFDESEEGGVLHHEASLFVVEVVEEVDAIKYATDILFMSVHNLFDEGRERVFVKRKDGGLFGYYAYRLTAGRVQTKSVMAEITVFL